MFERDSILITEDNEKKRISATQFSAPGPIEIIETVVKCSKSDTYDFETGALIALMKMCGVEKVVRACNEAFSEDTFKTYATKYERELCTLKKDFDKVNSLKDFYKKDNGELRDKVKELEEAISDAADALTELNDKYDKAMDGLNKAKELDELRERHIKELEAKFNKKVSDLRDQIHENSRLIQTNGELKDEVSYLKQDINRKLGYLKEKDKEINELKARRNAICGYRDTDNISIELPRTLDINGIVYRKSIQLKDFGNEINKLTVDSLIEESRAFTKKCVDEWLCKTPTKREKMWDSIKSYDGCSVVEVNKANINDFLRELEDNMPKVHWALGDRPTENKTLIEILFRSTSDELYFFIFGDSVSFGNSISYGYDNKSPYTKNQHITYLPPMRWDLFKKGRIVVACTEEEVPEFREMVRKELGNVRIEKYSIKNIYCNGPIKVYYHYDKDTNWMRALDVTGIPRVKINNHKVIHWENVK